MPGLLGFVADEIRRIERQPVIAAARRRGRRVRVGGRRSRARQVGRAIVLERKAHERGALGEHAVDPQSAACFLHGEVAERLAGTGIRIVDDQIEEIIRDEAMLCGCLRGRSGILRMADRPLS